MEKHTAQLYIGRLTNVLNCLRHQNSGADVHCVGNMRNSASGLMYILEEDPSCISEEHIAKLTRNVENAVILFFQKKFSKVKSEYCSEVAETATDAKREQEDG